MLTDVYFSRDSIIKAAMTKKLTSRDICEQCKISHGTFRKLFSEKPVPMKTAQKIKELLPGAEIVIPMAGC